MLPVVAFLLMVAVSADTGYPSKVNHVHVKFEQGANLYCNVPMSNLGHVLWMHNGHVCSPISTWCSVNATAIEPTDDESIIYRSHLRIPSVIRNGTYTCQAVNKDGKSWIVSENKVEVDPDNLKTWIMYGTDSGLSCNVKTPHLDLRLFRDDQVPCTPEWCLATPSTVGTGMIFRFLNVQANHTYTCVAYSGKEKLETVLIHRILVDTLMGIGPMNLLPPGPIPTSGRELVVTARLMSPVGEPVRLWKVNGTVINVLKDELTLLSDDPLFNYEVKAWLGFVRGSSIITLDISKDHQPIERTLLVQIAVKYGERCNSTAVCTTNNTLCDNKLALCSCRQGYHWDSPSSSCLKDNVGHDNPNDGMPSPSTSGPSTEPTGTPEPRTANPGPRGKNFFIKANVVNIQKK